MLYPKPLSCVEETEADNNYPMLPKHIFAWCRQGWCCLLQLCFLMLCLRFQLAAFRESYPNCLSVLILAAGAFGMGFWRPHAALFAFTLSVPLLVGLEQTAFLSCPSSPSLVFSGVWIGMEFRYLWRVRILNEEPSDGSLYRIFSVIFIIADILVTSVLLSLSWQILRNQGSAGLWVSFFSRSVFAYSDPLYFITSAFIWLQGLFFLKTLGAQSMDIRACDKNCRVRTNLTLSVWVKPVFVIYSAIMAVFFLIQLFYHIPEGWAVAGFQSPYEDISSFGSIALTVLVFTLAILRRSNWSRLTFDVFYLLGLFTMYVSSWSRAAWLAGILFLFLLTCLRLRRRWVFAFIVLIIGSIAIANALPSSWTRQVYLSRFVTLVRLERPVDKVPGRIMLYKRGLGMVADSPMFGHGIGSFYITSMSYDHRVDTWYIVPDFAHNVFLQIAAEQGVPVALVFSGLCYWALWLGWKTWKITKGKNQRTDCRQCQTNSPAKPDRQIKNYREASDIRIFASDIEETKNRTDVGKKMRESDRLTVLGVTFALGAYLMTQMTANSLNVYVSNQFFFWFLLAAVLCLAGPRSDEGEQKPVNLVRQ